jgi:hypothetical protein
VSITLDQLVAELKKLRASQLQHIATTITALQRSVFTQQEKNSDIAVPGLVDDFGDLLCLHHAFSSEPFTKDKFEHAFNRVLNAHGHKSSLASRGNPGHDLTVDDVPWSLKSQADRSISPDFIHISKFMELGKGKWETVRDLEGLRDQMLGHMDAYERIFTLRRLDGKRNPSGGHFYELVEIPKKLLLECKSGKFEMMTTGKQNPKPGYCTVSDAKGEVKFQLYFDGGTERKLQVKKLKKSLCVVHATWDLG